MKRLGRPFPDCSRCRNEGMEVSRKLWGCDEPADRPVFEVLAHEGGDELQPFFRCPTAVMSEGYHRGDLIGVGAVIRCYAQYLAHNVLPASGGYADQSSSWGHAVEILDSERCRYEDMIRAKQEREAEAAKRKSKGNSMTGTARGRRR